MAVGFRILVALFILVGLQACGGRFETSYGGAIPAEVSQGWRLAAVEVKVPDSLTVSDKDVLAPKADIVWHGDPPGDRRAQVAAILKEGISRGAQGLGGQRPVIIGATLERFHGITPRALSAGYGGVHSIAYAAQVFDAKTGQPLTQPQQIHADLAANVGAAAVVAIEQGQSQRVRVTQHIADTTAAWLGLGPDIQESFVGIGR